MVDAMVWILRNIGAGSPARTPSRTASSGTHPSPYQGDVSDREVQLELVLARVVLEKPVEIGLAAGKRAPVVVPGQGTDFSGPGHASAREEPGSERVGC